MWNVGKDDNAEKCGNGYFVDASSLFSYLLLTTRGINNIFL